MIAVPAPRARTRPAAAPATPMGLPVIGGPRRPLGLPAACTFPSGYYQTLQGTPIKVWPYRTGADTIGLYCFEYKLNLKRERVGVIIHAYELHEGAWRYLGKADDREEAKDKIDARWKSRRAQRVQPVAVSAPAPRARSRPSETTHADSA